MLAVRSSQHFSCAADKVWPLLCDSKIEGRISPLFLLGVPQPLQCRLPEGHGGVGSARECESDQGVVHQRILEWLPERRLSFRMEETDLPMRRFVQDMVDTIDLVPMDPGLEVTRTTTLRLKGPHRFLKKCLLFVGVKQVHRHVFRGWRRLAG